MDGTVVLGRLGRLVIPAEIRKALGLAAGRTHELIAAGAVTLEPLAAEDAVLAGARHPRDTPEGCPCR
jgi:AbrB family looped-hinge helix DNA binding protein